MAITSKQRRVFEYLAQNNLKEAKKSALHAIEEDTTKKNEVWRNWMKKEFYGSPDVLELPYRVKELLYVEYPAADFQENRYYLTEREGELVDYITRMNEVSQQLSELHISFQNSILLEGQSGSGKTTFARYLAYKLEKPLVYVDLSKIINSHLGRTQKNLGEIFSSLKELDCIFFLDEVDAIASKRSAGQSGADKEISRATVVLMSEIDKLKSDCVLLAATNIPEDLDPALLRRFSRIHKVEYLSQEEAEMLTLMILEDIGIDFDCNQINGFVRGFTKTSDITREITSAIALSLYENKTVELPQSIIK